MVRTSPTLVVEIRRRQETERVGGSLIVTRAAGIRMEMVPDHLATVMGDPRMAEEMPAATRVREMTARRAATETGNKMTAVLREEHRAAAECLVSPRLRRKRNRWKKKEE